MTDNVTSDRTIDLHAHTTASDGDHSPTDLVRHAAEIGLTAIAVTDHDTLEGIPEALEAGKKFGIEVVPGIELSAEISPGQCHLLGYFIRPDSPELNARLRQVIENRDRRNDLIIAKMNERGLNVTIAEVRAIAGGEVVARPHFARLLINRGVVNSIQEAFDLYLAKGASTYVDRDRLSQEEAIDLVHKAGGLIILAHPNNLKRDEAETEAEIKRLKDMGLDGIEARYNRHTPADTARYLALAERLGLLTSGGSDYHGPTVKPDVLLGHVEGDCPAPRALLDGLKARLTPICTDTR